MEMDLDLTVGRKPPIKWGVRTSFGHSDILFPLELSIFLENEIGCKFSLFFDVKGEVVAVFPIGSNYDIMWAFVKQKQVY